jgi:putative addiction module component (TIGR02574 family)
MATIEDIAAQALTLDVKDRAKLAERLLRSLDDISESEAEELWGDEAERRLRDYRAGKSSAIPADEVFRRADDLLR